MKCTVKLNCATCKKRTRFIMDSKNLQVGRCEVCGQQSYIFLSNGDTMHITFEVENVAELERNPT